MQIVRAGPPAPIYISKAITFTGAAGLGLAGAVPWFTVTGQVLINTIQGINEVNTTATASDTLAIGVTGSTSLFIGATDTANLVAAKPYWASAAPTASGLALPSTCINIGITANIIGTVAGTAFTAGRIRLVVSYTPLSAGASIA